MAAAIVAGATQAQAASPPPSAASALCDRSPSPTASEQDKLLRFAAVVREELAGAEGGAALISRSGLDLARFHIRYSHAAVAYQGGDGAWQARQLFFACDERRPRIYDQGVAGFATGGDDPTLGFVAIVRLPGGAARSLRRASADASLAIELLGGRYSANAHAFSARYQNCNQWVVELLAAAWGDLAAGGDLRERAQRWLLDAGYAPEPVHVGSHAVMFAATFVPFVHLDDHPQDDLYAMALRVSLPSTVEAFVRERLPDSQRTELCHDRRQVVVHHGWTPIGADCVAVAGDRVVLLD